MEEFVTVDAKALLSALKIAASVCEKKNYIPILTAVRLSVAKTGMEIEATDIDLFAAIKLDDNDRAGEWSICVNIKTLTAITVAAGSSEIRIAPRQPEDGSEQRQNIVDVKINDASYELFSMPPEDFPEINGIRSDAIEAFTNGMLADGLRKVAPFISTEETRYYLNGVAWMVLDGKLSFAATDGHRLATYGYASSELRDHKTQIIPRKTVNFILKHMSGKNVIVHGVDGDFPKLDFVSGDITLRSKMIDGTYPDVPRVIPRTFTAEFAIKREEFLPAIKQAIAIGGERGRGIKISESEGFAALSLKNPLTGKFEIKTSTQWPEGAPSIGINAHYLHDMISGCQGDITMRSNEEFGPVSITDIDKDVTRVLMPMRV